MNQITLDELRADIECEVETVDIQPYSHNIITLTLQRIAKEHGHDQANQAIIDFELDKLGWSPQY